ncbi:MAG: hypothetical protein ABWY08_20020 [Comamonas sp.]
MKPIYFLSIASALLALGLAVAGYPKFAALLIALATTAQVIASAISGQAKQRRGRVT